MPEPYLNYINGAWTPASTAALHENANPADTREVVSVHALSGAEDARARAGGRPGRLPRVARYPRPRPRRLLV